jgi:hypothetical protein
MSARTPYAVLGVPEGASAAACAAAFRQRIAEIGPHLIGAHADDRAADLAAWAELVEAWRALTPAR